MGESMVPELRFSEFDGDWEEQKVGDLCTAIGGGTPVQEDHYWHGNIPWVSSSDICENDILTVHISRYITREAIEDSATKIIPKNSLLVVSRVGVGKLAVAPCNLCTSQDFTNLVLQQGDPYFFGYEFYFNKNKLVKLSQGTSIKGITSGDLKSLKMQVPTPPEQHKIATFLTAIDKKIDIISKKKEQMELYKKGMMQKLFSQEIRFKDEDGNDYPDWEEKRLGEVFERIKTKNKIGNTNVMTISAQRGLVNQESYFNKSVASKDLSNYYLMKRGDFAYNKSYSRGYPLGAIKCLEKFDSGVVSPLYICFRPQRDIASYFFESYFDSGQINKKIHKVAQEGARNHGLLNIGMSDFFGIFISLPSLPEQHRIADFLFTIERKTRQTAQELNLLEDFKKGLLQKMFV